MQQQFLGSSTPARLTPTLRPTISRTSSLEMSSCFSTRTRRTCTVSRLFPHGTAATLTVLCSLAPAQTEIQLSRLK
eukprot:jgi/Chlat1/698/Chrsp104S01158